jgi:DNA-binding beta-propeller fold protein YncE
MILRPPGFRMMIWNPPAAATAPGLPDSASTHTQTQSMKFQPHSPIWPLPLPGFLPVCAFAALLLPAQAGVTVDPNIAYFYGSGRGEGLSVSKDGQRLLISTPTDVSASFGQPAETTFHSILPNVSPLPRPFNPFEQSSVVDLGLVEAADVAVLPTRQFSLVAVRANRIPQPSGPPLTPLSGALLAVSGDTILQTVTIAGRPDGVKASPDGRFAVVAVEGGGEIHVYDLSGGAGAIALVARVTRPMLEAYYIGVTNPSGEFVEPESIAFAPDSSFALITIQDSSSVAAIDLTSVSASVAASTLTPEQVGSLALQNVVHLPHGFRNNVTNPTGLQYRGVEPDGIAISPDGSFAITANETHQSAKHLAGLSVLDLRNGLQGITTQTYSLFDIDPTLLNNTGLTSAPAPSPTSYPTTANNLPRLDPTNLEIVKRNNQTVAAFVVERYVPSNVQLAASPVNETRGSMLFLEVSNALDGVFDVIDRVPVGPSGTTLEGVDTAQQGRWIFVSISNGGGDKGTAARLQLRNK